MTTTEWVERYNRAFEQAGLFQSPDSKFERQAYLPGSFKRLPPERFTPTNEQIGELFFNDPYIGLSDAMRKTAKVNERLKDRYGPIPSNPSPFDPHPGLDHQATDERALKGKETPTFTAPEDGYYFIGGYKTFCEAGMEVRAAVANIPDPRMSTDTEIKELVPADETI